YAGTDQEMLREMAEKDRQSKDRSKDSDRDKKTAETSAAERNQRRQFGLVEANLGNPSDLASAKGRGGAKGGGKAGGGEDDEDLFERAMDISANFNDAGARFKC